MSEFAKLLKEKREEKGLSLKDISSNIKVSQHYLEFIEKGEYTKLPSYVHAYGFAKAYCEFLGLNFDELKSIFDEECKKEDFERKFVRIESDEIIQKEVNLKNIHRAIILFVVVLVLILGVVYYFLSVNKKKLSQKKDVIITETVAENITKYEDVIAANETESSSMEIDPAEILEKIKEKKLLDNETKHKVTLIFNDICWVNIKIDNSSVLDFIAEQGTKKEIKFKKYFLIDIGNAAALTIKYDNITFSRFGGYRQPVKNLYFTVNEDNYLMYEKIK
ncbi:helix-turn-helix domain-containing protein [Deferribacter autotrophicus]|uniref:Helix-turn-helix domain-containing protein n=1 Tax=Deferribacter autotrophicus TaxID=500465 RepID=A0A5A8F8T7_9BACT|nr:helix-turn-helix domain-containing protein [Deferribacter autotrophicus]KAA0259236.1 helix-turn-helix domain-containing protein [Deferribacter autotrophicus]